MASSSIKIDDDLLELIRQDAAREDRSVGAQAAHYLRIGRAVYRSPDYDHDHIEAATTGGIEVGELSLEEQTTFFAMWAEVVNKPGGTSAFWEERKRRGLGVGETDDGQLVRQAANGAVVPYAA